MVAVLALALSACSAGADAVGSGKGSTAVDNISIGLAAEPASLDFTRTDGVAIPEVLLYNVYETLVKVDQSGELVPSLATSWEISKDRKTYTFQLVDDAVFTNGARFTAEDAKFSIDRVTSDWTISLKSAMDVVDSVRVVSPTELEVKLKQPSNQWLYRMTTRVGAMFSRTGVDNLASEPIGTGPFKLQNWTRGDSIVLVRNDDYWGEEPFFAQVRLKYFKDSTALNNALLSGTINVNYAVQSPESLVQFERDDEFKVVEGTTNQEVVLSFNNADGPMSELKNRQAVRYALDHQAVLDTCWAGRGTLIGSMVPPTDPWYEDLTDLYPYDPERAKELVEETGVGDTTLRLRLPTLPYAVSCGTVVQSMLEQVGFSVKLEQLEFPAAWLTEVFTNHDFDMSIIGHTEPRDLGTVFGDPDYYTGYGTPELQELLAAADTGTVQEQVANMKAAARLLSEDAAADFLFLYPALVVMDADITGLPENRITESLDLSTLGRS